MKPLLTETFQCAVCGSDRTCGAFRAGPAKAHWVILCAACGLAHLRPLPTEGLDEFQSADAAAYASAVKHLGGGFKHHHGLLLKGLRRFSPPPGRLLEIGSSAGEFLRAAKGAGYEVCGVEPAADAGTDRPGMRVWKERIETVSLPVAEFDAAVAVQVIEHMRDPRVLLEKMARALKPGGILYIETPNFGALARRLRSPRFMNLNVAPGHWHLFGGKSLGNLFRRFGIEPVRSGTFFKALSAYGSGAVRPTIVAGLNAVLGPLGLANTLAMFGRKT